MTFAPPLKYVCLLKFPKTIERTIGTISYCFKNNGLLSFAPLKFFLAESQPVMREHYVRLKDEFRGSQRQLGSSCEMKMKGWTNIQKGSKVFWDRCWRTHLVWFVYCQRCPRWKGFVFWHFVYLTGWRHQQKSNFCSFDGKQKPTSKVWPFRSLASITQEKKQI